MDNWQPVWENLLELDRYVTANHYGWWVNGDDGSLNDNDGNSIVRNNTGDYYLLIDGTTPVLVGELADDLDNVISECESILVKCGGCQTMRKFRASITTSEKYLVEVEALDAVQARHFIWQMDPTANLTDNTYWSGAVKKVEIADDDEYPSLDIQSVWDITDYGDDE